MSQLMDTTGDGRLCRLAHIDHVSEFLKAAGADRFPHAHGRTLLDHLLGTREILSRWLQPRWLRDAGALHSIYSTDVYRKQLIPLSERDRVREAVGEQAERLAYLFCCVSRKHLFALVDSSEDVPEDGLSIEARGPRSREQVERIEVFQLLILHMANIAEQSQGPGREPGLWLAKVSRLGSKLDESQVLIPPLFASCTRIVSAEQETRARDAYFSGIEGDLSTAAQQFSIASTTCPWIAEPRGLRAYTALKMGNQSEARLWIADARKSLIDLGACWDQRFSFAEWLRFIALLELFAARASTSPVVLPELDFQDPGSFLEAMEQTLDRHQQSDIPGPESRPPDKRLDDGVSRFHRYVESFAEETDDAAKRYYPGLSSSPWHDSARFPIVEALEYHFPEICDEIHQIDLSQYHRENERIRRVGAWDVFMLYERGRKKVENCARCPITTRIIETHPTVRAFAGLIYFSRMRPGTHIAPHRGPTNMRLRCHLGIQTPEGDCALRVGEETRSWSRGKCIVFDDYFEHEAWNHTSEDRVVLIVDLWHPDLTPRETALLEGFHRYAYTVAESMNRYWASNSRAAHAYD